MRIITSADDFGYCEDTVRATIECLEAGTLTGASIMANMPGTALAVAYARANPERSFGVHLTFAAGHSEAPVLPPQEIPGLVAPGGTFLPPNRVRLLALSNRLPVEQIAAEAAAQIGCLLDQGVRVSHVDSHFHMHKLPPFQKALRDVLPRFGITRVRNVQNVYTIRPLKSPTYWLGALWRRSLVRSFTTTPHFFMDADGQDDRWPEQVLERVRDGVLEVGVHPGYAEDWRNQERLRLGRFTEAAARAGHTLIPWTAL